MSEAVHELSAISAVILAGGSSSRMNYRDKAMLLYGDKTFLQGLSDELSCCGELLLSVERQKKYPLSASREIVDSGQYGPLGGICQALSICRFSWLLVVACDMPLFRKSFAERLVQETRPGIDAVVMRETSGRVHPLGALYSKEALPKLNAQISSENYRIQTALNQIRTTYLAPDSQEIQMLRNINTPEDLSLL